MILANHSCPNCKSVLEISGVTEGELVDCPECGKPFEIPFQKKRAAVTAVSPAKPTRKPINKRKVFAVLGMLFLLWVMCAAVVESEKDRVRQVQYEKKERALPPDRSNVYFLKGKVSQIVEGGVLVSSPEITVGSMDEWVGKEAMRQQFKNAAPEYEPVFVKNGTAQIDGEFWCGNVVETGVMQYKTVLGANKSVIAYRQVAWE